MGSFGVQVNSWRSVMESRNFRSPWSLVCKHVLYWGTRANTCAEDEKVSTDELQEKIAEFEDYVQSTDIAAMQSVSFLFFDHLNEPQTSWHQNFENRENSSADSGRCQNL